ncbi:hypothetical protein [Floridanema aerugineum]|uniref:Uncharacterized protein n=1 Tax=Floridaenema aerugineum BLCC-F46 TaxID=3153654 RepID=A0ABV4X314_9CYAN
MYRFLQKKAIALQFVIAIVFLYLTFIDTLPRKQQTYTRQHPLGIILYPNQARCDRRSC